MIHSCEMSSDCIVVLTEGLDEVLDALDVDFQLKSSSLSSCPQGVFPKLDLNCQHHGRVGRDPQALRPHPFGRIYLEVSAS